MRGQNPDIATESWRHVENCKSLFISTLNPDHTPHASYAPFIIDDEKYFYVLLSDLAQHTGNIAHNPNVCILLAEDEQDCQEIFARKRVIMNCTASLIDRDTDSWDKKIDIFKHRFGETIDLLIQLPDFNLLRLTPTYGTYVKGFGQAYRLNPPEFASATHISSGNQNRDNTAT